MGFTLVGGEKGCIHHYMHTLLRIQRIAVRSQLTTQVYSDIVAGRKSGKGRGIMVNNRRTVYNFHQRSWDSICRNMC